MPRRWLCVFAFLFLVVTCVQHAHASSDRVSFLHDIQVSDGEEADDAVCFLCSIRVHGKVNGDAVAFLGTIRSKGDIDGDAVSFLGGIWVDNGGQIAGDAVSFGGPLHLTGNASIGGNNVQFPLILVLLPFILLALLIYGIVSLIRRRRYAAYSMPPPPLR